MGRRATFYFVAADGRDPIVFEEEPVVAKIAKAAWAFLCSPQARRYEAALALGVYEAVRAGLGHP